MTKLQVIKKLIDKKNVELKRIRNVKLAIEEERNLEYKSVIENYFNGCLVEGDKLEVNNGCVEFLRQEDESSYLKDMITLRLDNVDWRQDKYTKITTSFYSTSDNSAFELNRMILIGKVAQVLVDSRKNILDEFNEITSVYSESYIDVSQRIFDLGKELKELSEEVTQIEQDNLFSKLEDDGLEFSYDEKNLHQLPDLEIRFDHFIKNIYRIEILSKSTSGKSAKVMCKSIHNVYDYKESKYKVVLKEEIVERVRMRNIKQMLNYSKEIIVTS